MSIDIPFPHFQDISNADAFKTILGILIVFYAFYYLRIKL